MIMNEILRVGLDVGSTTVKMIVMDNENNILFQAYERHYSDTKKTLIELLNKLSIMTILPQKPHLLN